MLTPPIILYRGCKVAFVMVEIQQAAPLDHSSQIRRFNTYRLYDSIMATAKQPYHYWIYCYNSLMSMLHQYLKQYIWMIIASKISPRTAQKFETKAPGFWSLQYMGLLTVGTMLCQGNGSKEKWKGQLIVDKNWHLKATKKQLERQVWLTWYYWTITKEKHNYSLRQFS